MIFTCQAAKHTKRETFGIHRDHYMWLEMYGCCNSLSKPPLIHNMDIHNMDSTLSKAKFETLLHIITPIQRSSLSQPALYP
jgi:hypothetical protein